MYYEAYSGSEIGKLRVQEAEREAERRWRFRKHKSKEGAFLTALATSVLSLFTR